MCIYPHSTELTETLWSALVAQCHHSKVNLLFGDVSLCLTSRHTANTCLCSANLASKLIDIICLYLCLCVCFVLRSWSTKWVSWCVWPSASCTLSWCPWLVSSWRAAAAVATVAGRCTRSRRPPLTAAEEPCTGVHSSPQSLSCECVCVCAFLNSTTSCYLKLSLEKGQLERARLAARVRLP